MLITDGQVSAIDAILAQARTSQHRIFMIGIGSSSADELLQRLARETRGACDFVAPGEFKNAVWTQGLNAEGDD